jgi:hypothetical protein
MTINPWEIPPFPTKGDDNECITFESVGRALTAWENFETRLFWLYVAILGVSGWTVPAERAYGAIATSRGRVDMLRAAGSAYLFEYRTPEEKSDELKQDLATLLNRAGDYASRRNEIAHGVVWKYSDAYIYEPRDGYVLSPPPYSTNKRTLGPHSITMPRYLYSSVEINHFREAFSQLTPLTDSIIERIESRRRA